MGDEGIDRWHSRMERHKRQGDQILRYDDHEPDEASDTQKKKLTLNKRRVTFWNENNFLPDIHDSYYWGDDAVA